MLLSGIYYGKTPIAKAYKSGVIIWSSGIDKDFDEQIIEIKSELLAYITTDALRISLVENDICISCDGSLNTPTLGNKVANANVVLNAIADAKIGQAHDVRSVVPMLILPKAMLQFFEPQNACAEANISLGDDIVGSAVEPNYSGSNVEICDDSITNLSHSLAQKERSVAEVVIQPYIDAYASILNKLSLLSKTIVQNEIYVNASESVASKTISRTNIESGNIAHSTHTVPHFVIDHTMVNGDVNVNADESIHGVVRSDTHFDSTNELNASASQLEHIDENVMATAYAPIYSDKTQVEQAYNDVCITNEIVSSADLVKAGKSHEAILMDVHHKVSVLQSICAELEECVTVQTNADIHSDVVQHSSDILSILNDINATLNSSLVDAAKSHEAINLLVMYTANVPKAIKHALNLVAMVCSKLGMNTPASQLEDAFEQVNADIEVEVTSALAVHSDAEEQMYLDFINDLHACTSRLAGIYEMLVVEVSAIASSDTVRAGHIHNDIYSVHDVASSTDLTKAGSVNNDVHLTNDAFNSIDSVRAGHIYNDIHFIDDTTIAANPTQANEVQEDIAIHLQHEATPVQSTMIESNERLMYRMEAELYADTAQGGSVDLGVVSNADAVPNSSIVSATDIKDDLRLLGDYTANTPEAIQHIFDLPSIVYSDSQINSQASKPVDAADDIKIDTSSNAVPIVLSYMQQSNDIHIPFHTEANVDETAQSTANDALNMTYVVYGVIGQSKHGDIIMPLLAVPHGEATTPSSIRGSVNEKNNISYESVVSALQTVLQQYNNGVFVNPNNNISTPDAHQNLGMNYLLLSNSVQSSMSISHMTDVDQSLMMDVKDTTMHVPVLICPDVGTLARVMTENVAFMSDIHDFEVLYNAIINNVADVSASDVQNMCQNENVAITAYNVAVPADLRNESILLNVHELFDTDIVIGVIDKINTDGTALLIPHNVISLPDIYASYATTNIADVAYANMLSKQPHTHNAINKISLRNNNIMLAQLPYSVVANSEITLNGDSAFCICFPTQMQNDLSQGVIHTAFLCKFELTSLHPALRINSGARVSSDADVELTPSNSIVAQNNGASLLCNTTLTMGDKWIYPVQQDEDLYVVQALRSTLIDNVLKLI